MSYEKTPKQCPRCKQYLTPKINYIYGYAKMDYYCPVCGKIPENELKNENYTYDNHTNYTPNEEQNV